MLVAVAVAVAAAGGSGVLGSIGSLISGDAGTRTFTDAPLAAGDGEARAPIVASRVRARTEPGTGRPTATGGERGPGDGGNRRGPAPGTPVSQPPTAPGRGSPPPAPATPPSGGGGGSAPSVPPADPPQGGAVQSAGGAVEQAGDQAPPPAKPVTDQIDRVVDTVTGVCVQLPACP